MQKYKWEYKCSDEDWREERATAYAVLNFKQLKEKVTQHFKDYKNKQRITDLTTGKVVLELPAPPKVAKKKSTKSLPKGMKLDLVQVKYLDDFGKAIKVFRIQRGDNNIALIYMPPKDKWEVGCYVIAKLNKDRIYEPVSDRNDCWMNVG